ncbi:hypothetical protein PFISCL1PPCAC_21200, partial [Pristionchus fissidentatus]
LREERVNRLSAGEDWWLEVGQVGVDPSFSHSSSWLVRSATPSLSCHLCKGNAFAFSGNEEISLKARVTTPVWSPNCSCGLAGPGRFQTI